MTEPSNPRYRYVEPSDDEIRRLLGAVRTIAVVGASSKPDRPSNGVFRRLLDAGYRVIPVNPGEKEVLGQPAYPSLEAVPGPVDVVDVFRRSEETPPIAASAVAKGTKVLWLQDGVRNDEAAAMAANSGLTVVMDRCLGATVSLLGITPSST